MITHPHHPLWQVGFRPFFVLACFAGMTLPLWWALVFTGAVTAPTAPPTFVVSPLQWHAHEMFYGFGWAALGGFLLTASKNWVGVRGWSGGALMLLVAAWLLDRLTLSFGAGLPPVLFWLATGLFQFAIVGMLMWTLYVQRVRGAESDNYFFWIILPLFLPAKFLLLQEDFYAVGWGMSLALFRVAFLIMLERTQVQFMRFAFKVDILRDPALDAPIKWLAVAMVFAPLMPAPLAACLALILAALLIERLAGWHPAKAFTRLDIGIMYLGYLFIVLQLLVEGVGYFAQLPWVGTVAVHLFTVGVMGLILPAMIVRISKGHTGRNVVFETADKLVLWIMIAAFLIRVLAPQLYPAGYAMWLHLSATAWLAGFGLLAWRYIPFLLAPRIDGREH